MVTGVLYMSPALGLKSSSTTDRSVTCGKSHYLPEPPLPHLFSGGKTPFPVTPQVFAAAAKSLQSCPTLCDPIDGSPPGSPVPGILQARTLEWLFLLQCMKVKSESEVAQSCPTLSDPMDCSLPGSSIHGVFQARVLEWGAIAFSTTGL